MKFREATEADADDVLLIHRLAFGREDEAGLVGRLLRDPSARPWVSLLAIRDGRSVGHVLCTAVSLDASTGQASGAILAPLAVEPACQRQGIGRSLIEAVCGILARRNVDLVFVLGDPDYYSRCGFVPALPSGLRAPYAIEPENAWMVRALRPALLGTVAGSVRCAQSLADEQYWRE